MSTRGGRGIGGQEGAAGLLLRERAAVCCIILEYRTGTGTFLTLVAFLIIIILSLVLHKISLGTSQVFTMTLAFGATV